MGCPLLLHGAIPRCFLLLPVPLPHALLPPVLLQPVLLLHVLVQCVPLLPVLLPSGFLSGDVHITRAAPLPDRGRAAHAAPGSCRVPPLPPARVLRRRPRLHQGVCGTVQYGLRYSCQYTGMRYSLQYMNSGMACSICGTSAVVKLIMACCTSCGAAWGTALQRPVLHERCCALCSTACPAAASAGGGAEVQFAAQ